MWRRPDSEFKSAAPRIIVSSASRGGSHHLAAMAAACSTLLRLCPGENVGQSACALGGFDLLSWVKHRTQAVCLVDSWLAKLSPAANASREVSWKRPISWVSDY